MNRVITDYRTEKNTIEELRRMGLKTVLTMPIDALYDEVRGHADMQIHFVNGKAVTAPCVFEYYKQHLDVTEVVKGSITLSGKYPYDIAYNTCGMGKYAVCNSRHTATEILGEYEEIIDVKQGYAKCSICKVNSYSAITADDGIYKRLKVAGMNVLKIREGYVSLYNMTGFIGGASGLIAPNTLAFNGDLKTHPDCESIISFCKNEGVEAVSLNKGMLKDIGSFVWCR